MPQPKPKSSLDNSCAAIHDNTLYVYTPEAFQSLKLVEGAEWEKLSMGESVTGATCLGSSPANADAAGFWVVGGAGGTTGLQKYSYSSGKWSSPMAPGLVTKDRQFHSTAYIKANDQILVFAGTNSGAAAPTSETFSIDAYEPYEVHSVPSAAAPNSIRPILLSWSDADAVMVGGDAANTRVYLFNPTAGWRDFDSSLAEPISKDTTKIQAALIKGKDGSQNLYLFDMSVNPNTVKRYVIQDASGAPVRSSPAITERSFETRQAKDEWPAYDSELAPTSIRENFAIAQGDDGMVVFAGGNDKEPLAMFDAYENSWLNATDVLTDDVSTVQSIVSSSTSSASSVSSTSTVESVSSTFTSTASATSTVISSTVAETTTVETTTAAVATDSAEEADDDGGGLGSNTILGITLGSIFAFLLVLALALFCLRRRKTKRARAAAAARAAHDGGIIDDEKDPRAFANLPPGPIPSAPGAFRGHRPQGSADSYSSMAILMGRVNQQKPAIARKGSNDSRASIISHHRQFKSTISKPIPQATTNPVLQGQDDRGVTFQPSVAEPRPRNGTTAPDPQDGTRRSSGWNRYWSGGSALQLLGFGGAKRNTVLSDRSSRYSQASNRNPRVTQDSATVPPLNFDAHTAVNRVNSGSPIVTGHVGKVPFGEGMAGKIERPSSRGSSGYSSGIPESVNEAWDPTDNRKDRPWGHDRAPSSVYNSGFNFGTLSSSAGGNRAPPTGVSSQPQLAMASKSSDMSWLNLGEQRNDQSRI
ncbi:hypothetical protein ACO1O0_001045 [Amphichorda felina]